MALAFPQTPTPAPEIDDAAIALSIDAALIVLEFAFADAAATEVGEISQLVPLHIRSQKHVTPPRLLEDILLLLLLHDASPAAATKLLRLYSLPLLPPCSVWW